MTTLLPLKRARLLRDPNISGVDSDAMLKQKGLQIVEGYFVSHIVWHLHHQGILEKIAEGESIAAVAEQRGYDQHLLRALLEFVCQSTDLLERRPPGEYRINPGYLAYRALGFHLDKFIGAYGPLFEDLDSVLRSPARSRKRVDDSLLTRAYVKVESAPPSFVVGTIRESGCLTLLDLGCGTASLLRSLCLADESFRGWGIDVSESMCREARRQIARLKLLSRIKIIRADARKVGSALAPSVRRRIEAIHLGSLLNEFCARDNSGVVSFLLRLKEIFPDRLLFVVDYYGKLKRGRAVSSAYRHTLLHDLIQEASSQGTPPPDLQSWLAIYDTADCTVENVSEGESEGIEWFLHIVRL